VEALSLKPQIQPDSHKFPQSLPNQPTRKSS
jgi:hypothetical protein